MRQCDETSWRRNERVQDGTKRNDKLIRRIRFHNSHPHGQVVTASPFKVHVTRTSEAPPQTNKHVG